MMLDVFIVQLAKYLYQTMLVCYVTQLLKRITRKVIILISHVRQQSCYPVTKIAISLIASHKKC